MGSGGLLTVSRRALGHAVQGDEEMTAAEVAWLDDGQLRNLIEGAKVLLKAAECELVGRSVPEATPTPEGPCDLCGEHRPAGLLKRVLIGGEWIWTCTDKEETHG